MNRRWTFLFGLALIATARPLAAEWISGGVSLNVTTSLMGESSRWIEYDCTGFVECAFGNSFTGTHMINDGASGTVASKNFSGGIGRYTGTLSAAAVYSHCYIAHLTVEGINGTSNRYSSATKCAPAPPPPPPSDSGDPNGGCDANCSPIVINRSNGPWQFSGTGDPVTFDIDANGRLDRITWTGRGEPLAFLALDRNRNGIIDDGAELFGTATPLQSGQPASNGFEVLREADQNHDGVVDATDSIWNELLLWSDTNHDGVSQPTELVRIMKTDIVALSTAYHATGRTDRSDNAFRFMSVLRSTGGQRPYYDVFFSAVK